MLSRRRAHSGDLNQSLKRLKVTLKYMYNPTLEFLICGDKGTDYLNAKGWGCTHTCYYLHTFS